jgi:hypothetical protein
MNKETVDTFGCIIVLATTFSAIALIYAAFTYLRGNWNYFWQNSLILIFLVMDAAFSYYVFYPQILKQTAPLVPEGTELLFCFVLPVIIIVGSLFTWGYLRRLNDDMPLVWTIIPQTFRAVGGVFIVYWAFGMMPAGFAIPAGIGDLIVGISAPFVAHSLYYGRCNRGFLIAWNLFGIFDFIVAFTMGFVLNTPSTYPLVLIPGLLVPIAIGFHAYSFRKLFTQRTL